MRNVFLSWQLVTLSEALSTDNPEYNPDLTPFNFHIIIKSKETYKYRQYEFLGDAKINFYCSKQVSPEFFRGAGEMETSSNLYYPG